MPSQVSFNSISIHLPSIEGIKTKLSYINKIANHAFRYMKNHFALTSIAIGVTITGIGIGAPLLSASTAAWMAFCFFQGRQSLKKQQSNLRWLEAAYATFIKIQKDIIISPIASNNFEDFKKALDDRRNKLKTYQTEIINNIPKQFVYHQNLDTILSQDYTKIAFKMHENQVNNSIKNFHEIQNKNITDFAEAISTWKKNY